MLRRVHALDLKYFVLLSQINCGLNVILVMFTSTRNFLSVEMYRTVRENLYSCTGLNSLIDLNSSIRFW